MPPTISTDTGCHFSFAGAQEKREGLAVCLPAVSVCGGACGLEMAVNDPSVDHQVIIKVMAKAGHRIEK